MKTFKNTTNLPVSVQWCITSSHWNKSGKHTGTLCKYNITVLPPGEGVSFDETQSNGDWIMSNLASLGLTHIP